MSTTVFTISAIIKALTLLMTLYTFRQLAPHNQPVAFDIYTRYFVVKRNYTLLRYSLLFVAALIVLELASVLYASMTGAISISDAQLLLSDFIFLGLVFLLSRIYASRAGFTHALDVAARTSKNG